MHKLFFIIVRHSAHFWVAWSKERKVMLLQFPRSPESWRFHVQSPIAQPNLVSPDLWMRFSMSYVCSSKTLSRQRPSIPRLLTPKKSWERDWMRQGIYRERNLITPHIWSSKAFCRTEETFTFRLLQSERCFWGELKICFINWHNRQLFISTVHAQIGSSSMPKRNLLTLLVSKQNECEAFDGSEIHVQMYYLPTQGVKVECFIK